MAMAPAVMKAQTGAVIGRAVDATGAAIPDVTITATATATGVTRTVTTNDTGVFTFPALAPANYTFTATKDGFATVTINNVTLNIAATLPVNFKMGASTVNTTVEVSGTGQAPVETDSFQLSTVIGSKQIQDLPLILRDPYQLTLLAPGVVSASNNTGGFSVNGARDRNNNFLLDGADNNDTSVPGIPGGISSANPDSTQEYRVITNNFDAEFGRNTGAVIDVITRSGTNELHGNLYEFGRYNALGARDYFNTKANGKQDPYVRNDFGASVGGPIIKDRSFFFLNGEVQRFRTTRTASTTTPTAAFRTGNFTYVDPTTGIPTQVNLNPANPANQTGAGIDPLIARIYALAPVGQSDNGDGATTTYFFASPDALNDYTITGNFQENLSSKQTLNVRYTYGHSAESDPGHDEFLPGLGATSSIGTNHNGVISLASQVTPALSNLFRAAYNQGNAGFFCGNHQAIDAVTGVDAFGNGRDLTLPGFFTFGCGPLGDSNGQARLSSTLLFADTVNVTRGAHSIKFGGDFRSVKDTSYDNFSSRAAYTFNNGTNFTADAYTFAPGPNATGNLPFQDLIWGATGVVSNVFENQFFTNTGVRRPNDTTRFRQHEWSAFAQDTWKVSNNLTLTYGFHYAFNGVPYELNGYFSNFYGDSSIPTPAAGFTFRSVGPGTGHQLYRDSYGMFEPRVGFAYNVGGKGTTAVRGGFGIFHDRIFDNLFGNARSNPPYEAQFNDYPFDPRTNTSYKVSATPTLGDLTPSATITDGAYLEPVTIDPNLKMPTTYSWNIGVQHHLVGNTTVEVDYVGNHNLHGLREIDAAPPQPALVQAAINSGVAPSALQGTALYFGGANFDPTVYNTAFYHNLFQTSVVSGNYNALQAKLAGQVGGLTITGSYTYAHSLDNGSDPLVPGAGNSGLPRNSFDLGPEYGSSDFDVRHRGTAALNYEVPIGDGKRFLNHGFMGHVFEGIELSGIQQVQTGLPFDLRGTIDNLHTSLVNRPQLVGNPYPANRGQKVSAGVITGVNRAAFANAPYGQSITIHRNTYHGPGFVNTDVVFQKTQVLHEAVKLQFRAESYNVLNHPNFTSPASDTISSALFGVSTSQVGQNDGTTGARQIQLALKLLF